MDSDFAIIFIHPHRMPLAIGFVVFTPNPFFICEIIFR